jgi:hypothetical protein
MYTFLLPDMHSRMHTFLLPSTGNSIPDRKLKAILKEMDDDNKVMWQEECSTVWLI